MTIVDAYDAGGRKSTSARDGIVTTYAYDDDSRLTNQYLASGSATFAFDSVGNVLNKWHQGHAPMTMSYDAASRIQTLTFGGAVTAYMYNAVGNLTLENQAGVQTGYVYDRENRLIQLTYPLLTVSTYTYEGSDGLRRTYQNPGSPVSTMIWDGAKYLGEIN